METGILEARPSASLLSTAVKRSLGGPTPRDASDPLEIPAYTPLRKQNSSQSGGMTQHHQPKHSWRPRCRVTSDAVPARKERTGSHSFWLCQRACSPSLEEVSLFLHTVNRSWFFTLRCGVPEQPRIKSPVNLL